MTIKPFTTFVASLLLLCASHAAFSQNLNMTLRSTMTFPGNTIANVASYAANGREYALLGGSKGMFIVDITNPDAPVQITQIPGPNNTWKEIKTFLNYAYVVSEGGQGVQIVDLSALPSAAVQYHNYTGDGAIDGQLNTIHALHIDVTKGFLYAYGSNLFNGGAVVLDLNADPYNPTFAGKYDQFGYIHDGYVDNDMLFAGHIGFGRYTIVDMANKQAPVVLGIQETPNHATHNTWLSDDRKYLFTTDEVNDSYLASYDVSDPADIKFLDKVQANPGSGSVVHNTHVRGNFAITSWYTSGVNVVDITRPDNLVQVGIYDTWPQNNAGGFDGCWGASPFFPSGNIIAANIPSVGTGTGELFVLTPNYQRACYLEGKITDALTNAPVSGATVELTNGDPSAKDQSTATGIYKTGQAQAGTFQLKITRLGYLPFTTNVILQNGEITIADVVLTPVQTYTVSGQAVEASTGNGVSNAKVALIGLDTTFVADADANGQFSMPGVFPGKYQIVGGAWGYLYGVIQNQDINANGTFTVELDKGYRDDFLFDYGWVASGTSLTGTWERGEPLGVNPGIVLAPETDLPNDFGDQCYVTGNSTPDPGADDVESGSSILTSPVMDLSNANDPTIKGYIWFTNFTQAGPVLEDTLKIYVSNGAIEKVGAYFLGSQTGFRPFNIKIKSLVGLSNDIRMRIVCSEGANSDPNQFDSYEAALDWFRVTDVLSAGDDNFPNAKLVVSPNPFRGATVVDYAVPEKGFSLSVFDLTGRKIQHIDLQDENGLVRVGDNLKSGVYFLRLEKNGLLAKTLKLVKTE